MSNIHHYNYPSFSSSLLEEIYRSFDNNDTEFDTRSRCHSDSGYTRRTKMPKTGYHNTSYNNRNNPPLTERDVYGDDLHRVDNYKYALQHWMEREKEKEKVKIRRNSMPDDGKFRHPFNLISSSSTSSSASSSSTISDNESLYGRSKRPLKAKQNIPSLKPIRTGPSSPELRRKSYSDETASRNKCGRKEGKLQLQQRALKLYGDLKKVKQPISPGGKLASFLNSLFHTNNTNGKKQRRMDNDAVKVPAVPTTPSTASSYSRSCLSKTPSSAGRFERRSVRFCPVTEVYNDGLNKTEATILSSDEDFKFQIMEKHRRVEEAAKELLKNYHSNNNNNSHYRKELKVNVVRDHNNNINGNKFEYEDEEEDDESCCSSDLFELDNLLDIGVNGDRYRQELPVYETTHLVTNRAIANGFIL